MSPTWTNLPDVGETGRAVLLALAAPAAEAVPGGFNVIRSVILTALGATLLWLAVARLRRYKLKERYALLFALSGLPFLVLAFWPGAILVLGHLLHMEYFTVMLLCVSTFLILMVFELLTIVSQQDQRIAALAQTMGILQEKQKELEQVGKAAGAGPVAAAVVVESDRGEAARGAGVRPEVTINPVTPRRVRDVVHSE